ncbi:hypothetical protein FQN57_000066 [Myotisia sp. PD_48]|nr:hypothetical protein FQN57_000066 [Myotisia sp. PD_48]
MATTPPPSTSIRTPPAPRHGSKYDFYEPYSPRRSSRIAEQCRPRDSSPEPSATSLSKSLNAPHLGWNGKFRQSATYQEDTLSPPPSNHSSPKKQRKNPERRVHPSLSTNTTSGGEIMSDTVPPPKSHNTLNVSEYGTAITRGMLPTPAKTPRKKVILDAGSAARTLFSSKSNNNDLEANPFMRTKSTRKKFSGFSLDSFECDPQDTPQEPITIFTDSMDRIPQINTSMDNPFNTRSRESESPAPKSSVDGSKRRKLEKGTQKRDKEVERAIRRDDGLLYVFRGKKLFRKFSRDEEEDEEDDPNDLGLLANHRPVLGEPIREFRPLSRSSIKPRVLFPEAMASARRKAKATRSTSEPPTEVEQNLDLEIEKEPKQDVQRPATPPKDDQAAPSTPPPKKSAISTPTTPLATGRSLRSHTKKGGSEGAEGSKRVSPFDRWRRTKTRLTPTRTKRRDNNNPDHADEPRNKRLRSA